MLFIIKYWDFTNVCEKEIYSSGWSTIVSDFEKLTSLPCNIILTVELKPMGEL